jgi:signal transduction histidine kinase
MRKAGWSSEPPSSGEGMRRMDAVLHDLCQPLTTLRCRLELAGLIGTPEAYREAVDRGVTECVRLVEAVDSMREIVRSAARAEATEQNEEVKVVR